MMDNRQDVASVTVFVTEGDSHGVRIGSVGWAATVRGRPFEHRSAMTYTVSDDVSPDAIIGMMAKIMTEAYRVVSDDLKNDYFRETKRRA